LEVVQGIVFRKEKKEETKGKERKEELKKGKDEEKKNFHFSFSLCSWI